jgi:hypothetical protein
MGGKSNPAANAENTALGNQQQVNQQIENQATGISNTNSQYYQAPLASEAAGYSNSSNVISQLLGGNYSSLLGSGGNLAGQTGINVNQLGQNLTGYASNTGATNLAQQNPALSGFYQNEMQNGINPQYAQNAQNQLAQSAAQQQSNLRATAAPGQNIQAGMRDIQNNQLAQSANLAGNLAGQSQTFANQGAQGVAGTASGLDAQTLSMLQAALSGGSGVNQDAIQNLISAISSGQTGLNNATSFTGQGQSGLTSAMGAEAGIADAAGSQAAQFGTQAQAQQSANNGIFGTVLNAGASAFTGGAAGKGGIGSILGKL